MDQRGGSRRSDGQPPGRPTIPRSTPPSAPASKSSATPAAPMGTRLTRRGRVLVALACAVAVVGGGGLAAATWQQGDGRSDGKGAGKPDRPWSAEVAPSTDGGGPGQPGAPGQPGGSGGPAESGETGASGEVSWDPPSRPRASGVPKSGSGAFVAAGLSGAAVGSGTLRRYQVQVEKGSGVAPDKAAAEVQAIVGHPRGWARHGRGRFQLVSDRPDFVIRIATPDTADRLCAEAGLDTGGELNCETGKGVVVNLRRWLTGSPQFAGAPAEYRHLIINHELGHALGLGHLGCPGPGRPAPVMMQQIKGLEGCRSNAFPYAANGTYLTGPTR